MNFNHAAWRLQRCTAGLIRLDNTELLCDSTCICKSCNHVNKHLSSVQDTRKVKAMQVGPGVTEPWTCPCIRVLHSWEQQWLCWTIHCKPGSDDDDAHNFLKCLTIVVLGHQVKIMWIAYNKALRKNWNNAGVRASLFRIIPNAYDQSMSPSGVQLSTSHLPILT